ncbi:MAG: asparagine synthase (glutamine-hydrolyzing), partial [Imperialibacter sp.]
GHRRLSIIDLSDAGSQPMHYANGRYTITFNGEIYNYIELREDLVKRGYHFSSHSDTEVLLALFDYKREECVQLLDGMFAFAIWDEQEQELFCARDRFGEKPFYYTSDKGAFAFASEMKELWALYGSREPEPVMIYNYLRFGFLTHPQQPEKTFYEGILNLPAAHFIWVKNKTITIKKYWEIDIKQTAQTSTDDAIDRFRELFRESVKRRLRSDVPVGSSLSGGLDSSLVVCVIDELLRSQGKSISTFSARFRDFIKDESKYQDYVISKTKAEPHFIYSESDVLDRELDKIFFHQEEPFGSASILVQYQVFELAKKNKVTVLLDGQGADEILAGYTPYYQTFFNELRTNNPATYNEELDAYMKVHEHNP